MELSEEAKSLWGISSVCSAPLLLSDHHNSDNDSRKIGPLLFNPSHDKTLTISRSLYSPTHSFSPPFPHLSLSRFLQTSTDSLMLPSTCSSIASSFTQDNNQTPLPHNSLHMMKCSAARVLLFFLKGQNLDQVGFLLLSVQGGDVRVKFSGATTGLNHRISKMSVQKIDDSSSGDFGFVFISTIYSVYWYAVRLALNSDTPKLQLLGTKRFQNSVVHACWSPHLPEECVVLLETGKLFLFDLESFSFASESSHALIKGKNLIVRWENYLDAVQEEGSWLSCELSWHPRILVVAHSSAVFLVDLSSEGCKVECLLRISILAIGSYVKENDRFVAFSRAGPDGFYYTVASNSLLFLCDVRNPLKPVLQWNHSIVNPSYITVVKLSNLRSNSKNDNYTWASENGNCILMGSFWNCECSLFCYGPNTKTSAASEISRFCKSLYAWELPSELLLASGDCYCGSCLVKEEFAEDALPAWTHWQQKKDIVLGFCILNKDISVELFEPENFGGFTVIRLMSSGNLELQRYFASREAVNFYDKAHKEPSIILKESLIYGTGGDEENKISRKFPILKFDNLYAYLNSKLGEVSVNEKKETSGNAPEGSFNSEFSSEEVGFKIPAAFDAIFPTGLKFDDRAIECLPPEFKDLFAQHKKFKLGEVRINEKKATSGNAGPEGSSKPDTFDAICPTGLKFDDREMEPLPAEFKYLFGQHKKFKNSFTTKRSSFRERK